MIEGKKNLSESQWDILLRNQEEKSVGNRKREGPRVSWRMEAERQPSQDGSVSTTRYTDKQGNQVLFHLRSDYTTLGTSSLNIN